MQPLGQTIKNTAHRMAQSAAHLADQSVAAQETVETLQENASWLKHQTTSGKV
jgi:hypothetical protein